MTRLQQLQEIEASLVKATGPLDMETRAELLFVGHAPKHMSGYKWYWSVATGDAGEDELQLRCGTWSQAYSSIHQFPDTSIDAALTLVPEGCEWNINSVGDCQIFKDTKLIARGEHHDTFVCGAIVLAAIRALIAQETKV